MIKKKNLNVICLNVARVSELSQIIFINSNYSIE